MIRRVLIATIVLLSGSTLFAPNKYFKRNDQVKAARHSDEKGQYKDVSLALGDCLEDEIMPEVDYRLDTLVQSATDSIIKNNLFQRIYRYFQQSNEVRNDKKIDFSIIGGPHFSKDTKLGLGIVASGLYRLDRTGMSLSPSNISLYGDITTTGFYLLGIDGNTIFPRDLYRLDVNMYFFSFLSQYWGIGYGNGKRNDGYTEYKRKEIQIKLDFYREIAPNTFIGVTGMYRHVNGKDFKDIRFLEGERNKISSLGGGLILTYDSRDFIPNPYKGTYAKIEQTFFPKFLGNCYSFQRTDLQIRHYDELWKGAVLAYDLNGTFKSGNTPWSMVAHLGKETLPSYGLGYRWEFKNRVNIRLDYGIGKGQSSFYFNINEAF
ncbi:BamA/TamA family outer membrane protein [Bacteroides faecis]|nr:BamA/TamA family outer membrane protein [Bacteroides faecis]MCS2234314.1 outer membrane protein assembly factor [Bacteroides faecis]MCS3123296.1 outer membrane protein assembly factor [Bacteroides faecis]MCY6311867.1 BamA/TamA family outer membrane protein [Bacteroides faecis]MDC7978441.1 BamA/TamA family outer membrane protein [Bacteroides faecis]UVQ61204.1 outer membrane protein assembly factor [Bacteroides faecis]